MNEPDDPKEMRGIREKTMTGQPLEANDFVERLKGILTVFLTESLKEGLRRKVDE